MRHLSRERLLDAAEGGSPPPPHLADCGSCRGEVEALRRALAEARSDRVEEPSPIFWTRFSARVADSIRHEAEPLVQAPWWRRWRLLVPAAACAVIMIIAVAVLERGMPTRTLPPAAPRAAVAEAPPVAVPSSEDDSWGVLTEIAAPETEADAAALVDVPGGAEAAAGELSDEEQGELARLLRVATAQAGSRTEG